MQIHTGKGITRHSKTHRTEQYFGPNRQEMTCPYCRKTMSAIEVLVIHMEIHPRGGSRNIETCAKLQTQDAPRGKWAKILLRMKGGVPEIQLQDMKYSQQPKEVLYTKSADRMKEREAKGEHRKREWGATSGEIRQKTQKMRENTTTTSKWRRK